MRDVHFQRSVYTYTKLHTIYLQLIMTKYDKMNYYTIAHYLCKRNYIHMGEEARIFDAKLTWLPTKFKDA